MSDAEKIQKVASLDSKESRVDKLEKEVVQKTQPVEGKFESIMDKKLPEQEAAKTIAPEANKPNVEDIAKDMQGKPIDPGQTTKELAEQTKQASQRIDAIKSELETPDLTIKKPVDRLMRNRLTHVDDSLRIALSRAGTEEVKAPAETGLSAVPNAATKFLDHLTHSQHQLDHLGSYLEAMVNRDQELTPANMLAIQVKVSHVQQELEFFTNLLNKSLESTKALMNVQV